MPARTDGPARGSTRQTDLLRQVELSRSEMIARGESLLSSVKQGVDPLGFARRDPIGSIAASVAAGTVLGLRSRGPRADGGGGGLMRTVLLFTRLLPALLPVALTLLRQRRQDHAAGSRGSGNSGR